MMKPEVEKFRLTKEKVRQYSFLGAEVTALMSDNTHKDDGFFILPPMGKKAGGYFLVRSTKVHNWHVIGVQIPTAKRIATFEELDYIRRYFFDEDSISYIFFPKEHTYLYADMVHIWQPSDDGVHNLFIPRDMHGPLNLRLAPFHLRLWRRIKRNFKIQVNQLVPKNPGGKK